MPNCEVCGKFVDVDADTGVHYKCVGLREPVCKAHGQPADQEGGCPRCYACPHDNPIGDCTFPGGYAKDGGA